MLFTTEERSILKNALTDGISVQENTDISELTMMIWEHVAEMPHPVECKFNIMGDSSIVNILNEDKEAVLDVHINKKQIKFSLCIPEYKFTQSDRMTAAFATFAIVNSYYKICAKQ